MMVGKNIRGHVSKALGFLLEHQYIDAGTIEGIVHRCVSGTGQGLTHSKAVAVASFLHAQELCGLMLAKSIGKDKFKYNAYCRFVDNRMFHFVRPIDDDTMECQDGLTDKQFVGNFLRELNVGLSPYSVKLEEQGRGFMKFLDIEAFKYDLGDLSFSYKPRVKTHPLWLSRESAHPATIHSAWPPAYLNRLWKKSCSISIYNKVKEE